MTPSSEPARRAFAFTCEKQPALGSRGMVVTNHPLASAAGAEILLSGGNAIDAAVAALFALTVVEPMMVGVLGGGVTHLRLPDGRHVVIDALSTAPAAARADMYETTSDGLASARGTVEQRNEVGASSIATPGNLAGWLHILERYGTRSLAHVLSAAIRFAEGGFVATPYLVDCVTDCAPKLARDAGLSALLLPGGKPVAAGSRVVQADYARTLKHFADEGPELLYGGALGATVAEHVAAQGGTLGIADFKQYALVEREPVASSYRGLTVVGPPPPASGGVHIAQMLNILEGFDIAGMGFGSPDAVHLIAEALKIAFADRAVATADPAFVDVPVERLISKAYAADRRDALDMKRAQHWRSGKLHGRESANTTHVTVADADGHVVSATHTINGLFGASVMIPGTGLIANNYMYNFDPHPGRALSIAPGKRVFSSMAPMMVTDGRRVLHALGLPGALRIFPSAFQAIVNLIDHAMPAQDAVEAPRVWTEGGVLEMEPAYPDAIAEALRVRGHEISRVSRIAGGMNAISIDRDGMMTGVACWRADGTPVGISGGLARAGVRFAI
jgi:gamma-glutamyltranspeptidase/glutathione hydrolase